MIRIEQNVDMTRRNTFGMKVRAANVIEYDSVEDLEEISSKFALDRQTHPVLHIGSCSNLLFTKDFDGTLLHSNIRFINRFDSAGDSALVEVGAGVVFDDFCAWAAGQGLWGVENLSGIPGETGSAAVQNIGAYGVEIKNVAAKVNCYDMVLGKPASFRADDCGYDYRDSLFKRDRKGRYVVTSVVFRLWTEPHPVLDYGHLREAVEDAIGTDTSEKDICGTLTPTVVRQTVLSIRNSKLPDTKEIGSAGSFFKNPVLPKSYYDKVANIAESEFGSDYKVPFYDAGSGFVKIPAAWLIEHCGWKGYREGNVGVHDKQPLVLVNLTGEARADEIIALENKIINSVEKKYGITLSPEVEHV